MLSFGRMRGLAGVWPLIVAVAVVNSNLNDAQCGEQNGGSSAARILAGHVVDSEGRAVAGAEVWLPLKFVFFQEEPHVAHAVADAAGRFRLEFPAAWVSDRVRGGSPTMWAYAPGKSLAARNAYAWLHGQETSDIELTLEPETGTDFVVLEPSGFPCRGARVEPAHFQTRRGNEFVPELLFPRLAAATDANGAARLPAMPPLDFRSAQVRTDDFGVQRFRLYQTASRVLRLKEVGEVVGRIVADKPEWARGVRCAMTSNDLISRLVVSDEAAGAAIVFSDAAGRFTVPALAAGPLTMHIMVDPRLPVRPRVRNGLSVAAGGVTEVEIPLVPAVRVHGKVRTCDTEEPVAGMEISVSYGLRQSDEAITDERGEFECYVLPGEVRQRIISTRPEFVIAGEPRPEAIQVPSNAERFELPPLEVISREFPIRIIDRDGQPMGGVRGGGRSPPTGVGALLSGKVVDADGRPVARASVVLHASPGGKSGPLGLWQQVHFGRQPLVTNSDGKFDTPQGVAPGMWYRATVLPGKTTPRRGEPLEVVDEQPARFAPLVVERLLPLDGRVVDARGKPLAGATVLVFRPPFTGSNATSDADGRFRVRAPRGSRLLVAEAAGYRCLGRALEPGDGPVEIVLRAADEPPEQNLVAAPLEPTAETIALAAAILRPLAERVLAGDDQASQERVLEVLVPLDPAAAWDKLKRRDKAYDCDLVRRLLLSQSRFALPDERQTIAAAIRDSHSRFDARLELFDALPAGNRQARLNSFSNIRLEAEGEVDPGWQLLFLMRVADRYLELGEEPVARELVESQRDAAVRLDVSQQRFEYTTEVAVRLARFGLEAALELPEQVRDQSGNADVAPPAVGSIEFDDQLARFRAAVAQAVAAEDPSAAERILKTTTVKRVVLDPCIVNICARMAPVDLERAKSLAAGLKRSPLRSYALGRMAAALPDERVAQARQLLSDAFREFRQAVATDRRGTGVFGVDCVAGLAASLLPAAERIDPEHLDEYVWRVVALSGQPGAADELQWRLGMSHVSDEIDSATVAACFIAAYDRELARSLALPAFERWLALADNDIQKRLAGPLPWAVLALSDAGHAVAVLESLPDDDDSTPIGPKAHARLTIARVLGLSRAERTKWLHRSYRELNLLSRNY